MKSLLLSTVSLFIFSSFIFAQEPVTQIEGFLEVYPNGDTTSVYIGNLAGQKSIPFVFQGIGSYNAFVGSLSGYRNTNGYGNSFFGSLSGGANTDGYGNSFFGSFSGSSNTDGSDNSFFGSDAGDRNKGGISNTFIGSGAGSRNVEGNESVAIGYNSGSGHSRASKMIFIGPNAGPVFAGINDSMQLYIDVKQTDNPLIYGDFDNDLLRVNGTLELGPQNHYSNSDDGVIRSPDFGNGSDLFLVSNDAVVLEIGNKSNNGSFQIWQGLRTSGSGPGSENLIFKVDKLGNVDAKAYNIISDVNRKDSFAPINTTNILDKIANLPITEWQYKGSTDRHIGPMAQDFYAVFGLGQGETTIATVDADGVALAAIQALNEKIELENMELKKEVSNLTERLERLERLLLEK